MTPPNAATVNRPAGAPNRRLQGLAPRLLATQLVVVIAGAVTLWFVALAVAPRLFTMHMDRAGETNTMVRTHAEQAFSSALGIALPVAAAVSVLTALAVSGLAVRRLAIPVTQLAQASDSLAAGDYQVELPHTGLGSEFERLTAAFRHMADRLAHTEAVRHRLLSDLAHELRTPLTTLGAHVDGLEDGVLEPSPTTLQVMRDQLERLQRLVTDIAQLSAAEEHALPLQLRPADLTQIATAAVQAASPRYQAKGVNLSTQSSGPLPVLADPVRMQQVLANLLDNALRHTPPGRTVQVHALQRDDYAVVEVIDSGVGIPAPELEAVFDRFHRVDPARSRAGGGSGLGLTIARVIVTDHGGTLAATNRLAHTGSTFTIKMPSKAHSDIPTS